MKRAVAERNELERRPGDSGDRRIRSGVRVRFEFDAFERQTLLEGLDDVARTLQRVDEIAAFETAHPPRFDLATV